MRPGQLSAAQANEDLVCLTNLSALQVSLLNRPGMKASVCALLQVDPDKAFAVSIQHDETVVQGPVAYMQCALLYTSSSGERRIRCGAGALPGAVRRAFGLSYHRLLLSPTCPAQPCHAAGWGVVGAPLLLASLLRRIVEAGWWPVVAQRMQYVCSTAINKGAAACRVHTLAMAVVDDAASLFRAADGAATLALLAKLTVEAAQQCKMEEARNKLQVRCSP